MVHTEFPPRLNPSFFVFHGHTIGLDLAVIAPRFLDTVVREARRHESAGPMTGANGEIADFESDLGFCGGITNKGKHGRDKKSGCNVGSRPDTVLPLHLGPPPASSVPSNTIQLAGKNSQNIRCLQ